METFESGEDLLAKLGGSALGEEAQCCVCDVRLPGMSGFELHRRLAELGAMPPWIFITAHDDQSVFDQARRLQAGYLLKPFEGCALLALVKHAIGEHSMS